MTATRSGRTKTTRIRVLTTLLDHEAYPARDIAVLYAERWQIEIAFLHLKRTVRGPRRPLRGQSPDSPARKPGHCCSSTTSPPPPPPAPPAAAGTDPGSSRSPPSSRLIRDHVAADACCRHCGHRPASGTPLASLNTAILALPRHRPGRQRTSGRTAAERRTRHTEEVTYTIEHHKIESPEMGHNSGNLRAVGSRE